MTHGEAAEGAPGGTSKSQDRGTTPSQEQVLKTTLYILTWVHTLRLQSMHELGSIREVDKTLAQTLMAEFTQLQLIVNEDLVKSLLALWADLEVSSVALVLDIARVVDFQPDDPKQFHMRAALRKFERVTS